MAVAIDDLIDDLGDGGGGEVSDLDDAGSVHFSKEKAMEGGVPRQRVKTR